MSRVKVSNCQSCQRWINAKHEDWEIIKKNKVELIKDLNCEHGTNVVDYYNVEGEHVLERTPKNFHYDNCPTCQQSIYKSNGWGDEWRDDNHVCSNQRERERDENQSCSEGKIGCSILYIFKPCPDCQKEGANKIMKCVFHNQKISNEIVSHNCSKSQPLGDNFQPSQSPTNWGAIILNGFFFVFSASVPFLLIFLAIRWLWRKGSKK